MGDMNTIMAWEDGEEVDLLTLARAILRTGLHRSAGRYGRVVDDAMDEYGPEQVYMDGELFSY